MRKISSYFSMIKFSHTIFSMPFAIVGFFMATKHTNELPDIVVIVAVILSLIFARNSAMAFNRWVDHHIDSLNPRTKNREIPARIISAQNALMFTGANALLFISSTYFINSVCFYLSPLALLIIFSYSYSKHYSWLCHFLLGLSLMIAPIGAFLAVSGIITAEILLLGFAVLFWVAGFDILYSIQDIDFDIQHGLFSIPSRFGDRTAIQIARSSHLAAIVFLFAWWLLLDHEKWLILAGIVGFVLFLLRQHLIIKPGQYHRINSVFFASNGIASVILCIFYILSFFYSQ